MLLVIINTNTMKPKDIPNSRFFCNKGCNTIRSDSCMSECPKCLKSWTFSCPLCNKTRKLGDLALHMKRECTRAKTSFIQYIPTIPMNIQSHQRTNNTITFNHTTQQKLLFNSNIHIHHQIEQHHHSKQVLQNTQQYTQQNNEYHPAKKQATIASFIKRRVLESSGDETVFLNDQRIGITVNDMKRLYGFNRGWINDTIIYGYLRCIQSDSINLWSIYVIIPFFLISLQERRNKTYDRFVIL